MHKSQAIKLCTVAPNICGVFSTELASCCPCCTQVFRKVMHPCLKFCYFHTSYNVIMVHEYSLQNFVIYVLLLTFYVMWWLLWCGSKSNCSSLLGGVVSNVVIHLSWQKDCIFGCLECTGTLLCHSGDLLLLADVIVPTSSQ
jgi:hypothetical protein